MLDLPTRVAIRYAAAQEEKVLSAMAGHVADLFLDELAALATFSSKDVEHAFGQVGITAEDLGRLQPGAKTANMTDMIHALGGRILKSLWHMLTGPFVAIGKLIRSPQFRHEIKTSFARALSHEVRSTRHMVEVAIRMTRGEEVNAQEKKAALHQMIDILTKVVLVYFAGPHIAELFSGGIWKAFIALVSPVDEIAVIMLDRPLRASAKRLLSADLGLLPSGFYTHF